MPTPSPEHQAAAAASDDEPGGAPGDDRLARLARGTVMRAARASLSIHGVALGPGQNPVLSLHADDGWPVLRCDPDSALAAAATDNRAAVLTVHGPVDAAEAVTVLLTGSLEMIGPARENGRQVAVVTQDLEHVVIETRVAGRPAVARPVPVEEYAGTDPAMLAACARHLAEHANQVHGGELRRFASTLAGVPAADVAGAWLADLDVGGTRLAWIGPDGGHAITVSFPHRARTAMELSLLLRQQVNPVPDAD